jgi:hypothetical protein
LLTPERAFLGVEPPCIGALTAAGQDGAAGGMITNPVWDGVGDFRLRGECIQRESRGRQVKLLQHA